MDVNSDNNELNKTFYKVFKNKFIRNEINQHLKKYTQNKHRIFASRKELIECSDRDYIQCIEYFGDDILQIGDLPRYGVLKIVCLKPYSVVQNSNTVPFGVLRVLFNQYNETLHTDISKLPHSVVSVVDYMPLKPLDEHSIPNSITSLKFNRKSNQSISSPKVLKESLKYLETGYRFKNGGIKLKKGDFPNSLVTLKLSLDYGYVFDLSGGVLPIFGNLKYLELTCFFNLKVGDIPESVLHFKLSCYSMNKRNGYMNIQKGLFPNKLLKFELTTNSQIKIENDSFPSTLQDLILNGSVVAPITKYMLPQSNNLKNLLFKISNDNEFYIENDALPKSLETLNLHEDTHQNGLTIPPVASESNKGWKQIIGPGFLPQSLTSVCLPNSFNQELEITNLNLENYKIIEQNRYDLLEKSYFSTMYNYVFNYSNNFDYLVTGLILPNQLKKLAIGSTSNCIFNKPILENQLPKCLENLTIRQKKYSNFKEYNIDLENGFNNINNQVTI